MIKNIEEYHSGVREKSRQMAEKKRSIPDDVTNYIFLGKNAHDAHLNSLFSFLEFIVLRSNEGVSLGTENIDKLWRLFVQQPNFNSDQALFLKWINEVRTVQVSVGGYQRENKEIFLFNDEERRHFFTKILCSPTYVDFQKISIGQVKSFHKFFKVINRQEGFISLGRKL